MPNKKFKATAIIEVEVEAPNVTIAEERFRLALQEAMGRRLVLLRATVPPDFKESVG